MSMNCLPCAYGLADAQLTVLGARSCRAWRCCSFLGRRHWLTAWPEPFTDGRTSSHQGFKSFYQRAVSSMEAPTAQNDNAGE